MFNRFIQLNYMKIRVNSNLTIDSRTLMRIEWKGIIPRLVVHEKFEKHLKWALRILTLLGILSGLLAFDKWYFGLIPGSVLVLIEQFIEKSIIEFTSIIIQPPPNFRIEYNQWKTNGFMIPKIRDEEILPHFGPTYKDEVYATNFFNYVRSWVNNDAFDDLENNIVVSIVIEPDHRYTTYLYANPERSRLNDQFEILGEDQRIEKYGKNQQRLVAQMYYWKTLDFKKGYHIEKFLEFYKNGDPYYLTPSLVEPFNLPPTFLTDLSIKKYELKVKKRQEVGKRDPEYPFTPDIVPQQVKGYKRIWSKAEETHKIKEIERALSNPVDLGFTPNEGTNAGVINICYEDCELPLYAYEEIIKFFKGKNGSLSIDQKENYVDLKLDSGEIVLPISIKNVPYNSVMLNAFLEVQGGGENVVFAIGYPAANERKLVSRTGMSFITVNWVYNDL